MEEKRSCGVEEFDDQKKLMASKKIQVGKEVKEHVLRHQALLLL